MASYGESDKWLNPDPSNNLFWGPIGKNRQFWTDLAQILHGGSKYPRISKTVSYGDSANSK